MGKTFYSIPDLSAGVFSYDDEPLVQRVLEPDSSGLARLRRALEETFSNCVVGQHATPRVLENARAAVERVLNAWTCKVDEIEAVYPLQEGLDAAAELRERAESAAAQGRIEDAETLREEAQAVETETLMSAKAGVLEVKVRYHLTDGFADDLVLRGLVPGDKTTESK